MSIRIKNWSKHQHFKDRTPPWIKLYREILDDPDWHELDGDTAKVLIGLWLIASEDETHQGTLPEVRKLAFRLRMKESQLNQALTKLSDWLVHEDINTISKCYQSDAPERAGEETEGETEGETDKPAAPIGAEFPPGFAKFWEAWPTNDRKQAKGKCLDAWKKARAEPDAAFVIDHVLSLKSSAWLKDGGNFVPAPLVYLNQRRWEGTEAAQQTTGILAGAI